jgi:hypothetical protein
VHPRPFACLTLLVATGCFLPVEEDVAQAELTGRVTTADGRPAAGARVLVELRLVAPAGAPDAGACRPETQGGGGATADAGGRYRVAARVALAAPYEACVYVRAALPPRPVGDAPAVPGPRLRWPAAGARVQEELAVVAVGSAAP